MPASTALQPAQHIRTTTITASDVIKDFVLKAKTKEVQENKAKDKNLEQNQGQKTRSQKQGHLKATITATISSITGFVNVNSKANA